MFVFFRLLYKKMLFKVSTLFNTFFVFLIFWLIILAQKDHHYFEQDLFRHNIQILKIYVDFFVLFMLPIFIANRVSNFISEEIESGELLVSVAKPISRERLVIEKFLAFQVVIMSWVLACLGIIFFILILNYPYNFLVSFMIRSSLPVIFITFIYQIILSTILIFLSFYLRSTIVIALGSAIAILNLVFPRLIAIVSRNSMYQINKQRFIGLEMSNSQYEFINQGQKRYKNFVRFFDITEHIKFIFASNMKKMLLKNDLSIEGINNNYNQEVVTKTIIKKEQNTLGEWVDKKKFIVSGFRDWFKVKTLYFSYFAITILVLALGFFYFKRKDIA